MNVLFDECMNRRLIRHLTGHNVKTSQQMGWGGIRNGALLRLAETQFDVFVTIDKNLQHQQNLGQFGFAIIVIDAASNNIAQLLPLVPQILAALPTAPKGAATVIT